MEGRAFSIRISMMEIYNEVCPAPINVPCVLGILGHACLTQIGGFVKFNVCDRIIFKHWLMDHTMSYP